MSLFLPASAYNHEASIFWANKVVARPRSCWWNALHAIRLSRGRIGVYIEGFALAPYGMVLDHGWIETPDGKVIDPTFPVCTANEPDSPYRYMPGLRFSWELLKGKRKSQFPIFNNGGKNFKLEHEEPWASTRLAAYAARNRLEAANAGEED